MPQMAPMSWSLLAVEFFFLFFVFMSVIFMSYSSSFNVVEFTEVKLEWKW